MSPLGLKFLCPMGSMPGGHRTVQWKLRPSGRGGFHPGRLNTQGAIEIYNPAQNVFSSHNTPFVGMPSPHIPIYKDPFAPDWPLLAKLLRAWELRYLRAHTSFKEYEPVFRSLEMAYRALQVPIPNEGSIQDVGTALGLWVSAFEILAHPS